ncbi:MAG: hypothetical protein QMD46_07490 [Methanomicrobiales archaeon]|nr:hypothetical protein [Methanomicrobiales archaeon]MDI6876407.1 hypothetical protein [Methanomicrobiales archaeon]
MQIVNEYFNALRHLYEKSLMLESPSDFHPVLHFFLMDSLAHLDYTLGVQAFNFMSIKNEMSREYLRWRIDEEKKGERAYFPEFINWLKENDEEMFESLPMVWQLVYDRESSGGYRSFRLVIDPDSTQPIPARFFIDAIDEFFDKSFIKSLYKGASLANLFESFLAKRAA